VASAGDEGRERETVTEPTSEVIEDRALRESECLTAQELTSNDPASVTLAPFASLTHAALTAK
jgi:hypothetical protein